METKLLVTVFLLLVVLEPTLVPGIHILRHGLQEVALTPSNALHGHCLVLRCCAGLRRALPYELSCNALCCNQTRYTQLTCPVQQHDSTASSLPRLQLTPHRSRYRVYGRKFCCTTWS